MSHEITIREDGTAEAVYANKAAWHELGTVFNGVLTSSQALKLGKLDWNVLAKPAYHQISENDFQPVPNRFVTYREDNNHPLGIVSNRYQIIQNREAFEFLDTICAVGNLEYESAGSLKGGKRVWIMCKFPTEHAISPDDINHDYLAVITSHDGTSPLIIMPTSVRIVCWNTLQLALNTSHHAVRLRHSSSYKDNIEGIQKALGIYSSALQQVNNIFKQLAQKQVSQESYLAYIDKMFPMPVKQFGENDDEYRTSRRYNNNIRLRNQIYSNFREDSKQLTQATNNTAYGLFNSVTQYVDHERNTQGKSVSTITANRLESSWLGSGSELKKKALTVATDMFL